MKGLGVSKGFCYGKILVYEEKPIQLPMESKSPDEELEAFENAIACIYSETNQLKEKAGREAGDEAAAIFDAHCSIIMDESMRTSVSEAIHSGMNAAAAVGKVMDELLAIFAALEDEYMASRAADIKDIMLRIQRSILGIKTVDLSCLSEPVIIAARDLTPSVTASMDMDQVEGILLELGGNTSHTAILARTMEIPAITSVPGLMDIVHTGDEAAFNGQNGELYLSPTKTEIENILHLKEIEAVRKEQLKQLINVETSTLDGHCVDLWGNIGTPKDLEKVLQNGGEGIGLFRSEFLYLEASALPTETKQFISYKKVLKGMENRRVIIRTLDIGGDKDVPSLGLKKEENPFLGLRAIRLCKAKESLFKIQLRALLKASVYGNLAIMFPMITNLSELKWAKGMVEECKEELRAEGIPFADSIPLGMMIEVPAAAIMAEVFARECDFFSIGTNDLTQYVLAVDRGNETVAELYDSLHPAVIHLIKQTIDGAHKAGIPCGMCGEAAASPIMIPLLLGLELDEFSVTASALLDTKEHILRCSFKDCQELAKKALEQSRGCDIKDLVEEYLAGL